MPNIIAGALKRNGRSTCRFNSFHKHVSVGGVNAVITMLRITPHRYLIRLSRRLFDIFALCIFFYSMWFYMSAPSSHHSVKQRYGLAVNHERATEKYVFFSGEKEDDFNKEEKTEEHFEHFEDDAGGNPLLSANPPLPANISDAQKLLNYIAANVHVTLQVTEATNQVKVTMINTGTESIIPSNWYIVLCHAQNTIRQKHSYRMANARLQLDQVEGNIFILTPTKWFKSFDTGERIEFTLGVVYAGSDFFPNWYVTAPGLVPRVIMSTEQGRFYMDYSKANDKHFTPLSRYKQNLGTSLKKLDGRWIHVIPTPKTTKYKDGVQPVYSVGLWSEWSIMYTSEVFTEAEYLSNKLGNLPFTFNKEKKFIQMTTGQVVAGNKIGDEVHKQMYQIYYRHDKQIITILGVTSAGVFYGIQTLLGLISHEGQLITDIPEFNVIDYPRLPYRGLMLDTARLFIKKKEVLHTLAIMATYKLNVLHLHLSDDQGWRLAIPGLEELTQVGSTRLDDMDERKGLHPFLGAGPHGNTHGSGCYSVSDYREIIRYANRRHIKVIPEIDVPGHAHAALISMRSRSERLQREGQPTAEVMKYSLLDPEDKSVYTAVNGYKLTTINPCINSTFTFMEHVISAIKEMHQDIQPLTTFHLGGDEVPEQALTRSPLCVKFKQRHPELKTTKHIKQYFMMKSSHLLKNMNISLQVWEDGVLNTGDNSTDAAHEYKKNIYTQIWKPGRKERITNLAKQGYRLIFSEAQHVYFDHRNEPHIADRGYDWATSYVDMKKTFQYASVGQFVKTYPKLAKHVTGIEAALWGETIQTKAHLHGMLYPRLLAFAERAWHEASWETAEASNKNADLIKDWNYFANIVSQKELYRLEKAAIEYYIPPPGISVQGRTAYVNTAFPGLTVDISVDGGFTWKTFNNGSKIPDGRLYFVTRSVGGTRQSKTVNFLHETKETDF